ncbi:hypothetical protein Tco_0159139 [Tanacetum coccineum]
MCENIGRNYVGIFLASIGICHRVHKETERAWKTKGSDYLNSKIIQVIKTYWELGHEHKFITEIVPRRANECIVSITEPDYKNLNKNDIEEMYLLIMNGKKVNLTAPTISFPRVKKNTKCIIHHLEPCMESYQDSEEGKRVMRHSEIHKFCDTTLNIVLEGLRSYNNDVKYGYIQRDLTNEEVEYLKLFEEEIEVSQSDEKMGDFVIRPNNDDDDDDEDPPAGQNQGKNTKSRRNKESESSKKPSSTKETPKGKAPSKGSKFGKSTSTKEPFEKPIAEVVMDDAGKNVVRDDDQPQDTSEPKTATTPNPEWFKQPPRPPTPDPEWNKRQVVLVTAVMSADSAVTYTSVYSEARSWSIPSEDPYKEAARQLLEHTPRSPEYVPDPIELEDHVPVYI